jgi:hypothetical protein
MILSTGRARGQVSHPERKLVYFGSVSSVHPEFTNKNSEGE